MTGLPKPKNGIRSLSSFVASERQVSDQGVWVRLAIFITENRDVELII